MGGALVMVFVMVVMIGITIYLVGTLVRSIQNEKRTKMRLWKNFGLSLGFCSLFFISWVAQAAIQWQQYTDEQVQHGQDTKVGDYLAEFSQATLENWQSEFLQLFSFTVMAAVLIHKGSAESKDSDDRIEAALQRIENKLGTEPTLREPEGIRQDKGIHVIRSGFEGWALKEGDSSEPEGYYDLQEEAIEAGRELAKSNSVGLFIHGEDGKVRETQDFGS